MISTAYRLANASPNKPRQTDLRRAISTAYYALYHAMARDGADMLVGVGRNRPDKAWTQVYRSLQHGEAKNACAQVRTLGFPPSIVACSEAFVLLQQNRHSADYDPNYRILRGEAIDAVALAERGIASLKSAPKKDRRAFAVLLLLKRRT